MTLAVYTRASHAAHGVAGRPLHDLERWDAVQPAYASPRPAEVPSDAERHSGYLRDGVQHVIYVRRAPVTGLTCRHCEGVR